MLGAIIGDIVGSRWEFSPTNDYNFELFSDKNSFTDDTICTVAVADALLHDSDDFGAYIHKWCRKYPHPMGGYGGRFAKWVMSDNPQPYGSYGNGSAMRVSPIGWWYVNDLWKKAAKSAASTHNHEEGIKGAQAVVWAMADAKELRATYGDKLTEEIVLNNGLDHGVGIYEEFPQNFNVDLNKYRNKFDETCQGTVPVALWIVLPARVSRMPSDKPSALELMQILLGHRWKYCRTTLGHSRMDERESPLLSTRGYKISCGGVS